MNSRKRINGGGPLEWYLGVTAGHGDYGTLDGEPYVCHLPEYESDYALDGDPDATICFADFARDCPNAQRTANSVILLPTYPRYSQGDVERNIRVLRGYFRAD